MGQNHRRDAPAINPMEKSSLFEVPFTLHPKPTTEIAVVASPTSVGGELGAMFDVEVNESPA